MRPPPPWRLVAAVAVGGAVGAVLRWALGEAFPDSSGFPVTTFVINLVGSFALASLPALARVRSSQVLTVGLGPGLLGGFTTLSATSEQARELLADGRGALAAAYLLGTLGACLVGVALARHWSTPMAQLAFEAAEGNE